MTSGFYFKYFVFFLMFEFYPVGNPILLAHIWILHIILDRIAPKLECFKKNCLRSKYPNRVYLNFISRGIFKNGKMNVKSRNLNQNKLFVSARP